jgi:hypothetical protein
MPDRDRESLKMRGARVTPGFTDAPATALVPNSVPQPDIDIQASHSALAVREFFVILGVL